MNKKALFFDIDGTIVSDITGKIPDSTINAISQAKANGHFTFINTGRTYCNIPKILQQVDFDGYLCGCGTYLVCQDKLLFSTSISNQRLIELTALLNQYYIDAVFEGSEDIYFKKDLYRFEEAENLRNSLIEKGFGRQKYIGDIDILVDKLLIFTDKQSNTKAFFENLKIDFDIIDRRDGVYEIVPLGYSKATAIAYILNRYNIPKQQAYVFGDSTNDLPMFSYIPNAIAMGFYDKSLEPYLSFVTKTVEEDGIEYALQHFGII